MTPEEANAVVRASDLMDQPDMPVRDQLEDEARSMGRWAGFNLVIFSLPIIGREYLGTAWSILICAVFLGKTSMYVYEARRLREAIECFDHHDAKTVEELLARSKNGDNRKE